VDPFRWQALSAGIEPTFLRTFRNRLRFRPYPFRSGVGDNARMKLVVLKHTSVPGLRGFTLVELIVATAILVILTGLAVPLARVAIGRENERELRTDCGTILFRRSYAFQGWN
jgi:prepilin-type N-terminal cleavage/methylation domain-containing protein